MAKKRAEASKAKGKARGRSKGPARASAIPAGFHTLTPHLTVRGAAKALEFYKEAFGGRELTRQPLPDGRLLHASVKIGDSILMLNDEFPEQGGQSPQALGGTPVTIHLYAGDVDKLWDRAVAAGCKVTMPLEDMFWGERYGKLEDPFGFDWSLASSRTHLSKKELEAKRAEAMANFG